MSAWKLIVFDWDGTLMDSTGHIISAVQAACRDVGLAEPPDDAVREVIGLGLRQALERTLPDLDGERYARFVERYRQRFFSPELATSTLYPGALDVLRELRRRGHWLAVATGKGRNGLDRALAETGIGRLLLDSRCADECHSKPHPQMLQELMRVAGADPGETLMIGDTTYDLEMARNAGTASIGVRYGAHEALRLLALGPVAMLGDIRELPEILARGGD